MLRSMLACLLDVCHKSSCCPVYKGGTLFAGFPGVFTEAAADREPKLAGSSSSWPDLLDDVFCQLLLLLSGRDVAAVRHTCKAWRTKTNRMLQDLTPKHLDKPEDLKVFEGMTSLELVLPAQVIHGALPYLSHLVFLQSLLMNGQWTHSSEPQACIEKLGTCRRLQKLQLCGFSISQHWAPGRTLPALHTLVMADCCFADSQPVLQSLKGQGRLRVLVLEGCLDQCWPAGASDVLEAWQLDLVSLSDSPLLALRMGQTAFSGLNQIQRLGLAHCSLPWLQAGLPSQPCLPSADGASRVKALDLTGSKPLTSDGLTRLFLLFPHLERLDMGGLQSQASSGLKHSARLPMAAALSALSELRMRDWALEEDTARAIACSENLRTLELSNCTHLTNRIAWLLASHGGLTHLDLSGSPGMDDWGIATLARDLPALQSLNLSQHHTAVTDLTVRHLAPLQHLTSLSLCNCDRITDQPGWAAMQGAIALVWRLPQLQAVHLSGCDRLTDTTVRELCRGLRALRDLSLDYCPLLSPACLPALCVGAANLRSLRLFGCNLCQASVDKVALAGLSAPSGRMQLLRQALSQQLWWMEQRSSRANAGSMSASSQHQRCRGWLAKYEAGVLREFACSR